MRRREGRDHRTSGLLARVLRASLSLLAPAAASLAGAGCDMPPRGPIDVRDARIVAVNLQTASGSPHMCPGADIPLTVDIDAILPGSDQPQHLLTNRRRVDDAIFDARDLHLSSPDGIIDGNLVLHTSSDPLPSATHGFLVTLNGPHGPSFGLRYAPSYDCVVSFGSEGAAGLTGGEGDKGLDGVPHVAGHVGETGTVGGAGGPGPKLVMYATYVRTPYYPRLLAVISEDGHQRVALANPGASLVLDARGGVGGAGGHGGPGGRGDVACAERAPTHGSHRGCIDGTFSPPGPGGEGGTGGQGGAGGDLELHVDVRFPEIAHAVVLDVHGGDGGLGGVGGEGGAPAVSYTYAPTEGGVSAHGYPGAPGKRGEPGASGTASIVYDDVTPRFDGRPGIVPL